MIKEWDAKLYIHNTPHCIAAFYGYLNNCEYVHDALAIDSVKILWAAFVDANIACFDLPLQAAVFPVTIKVPFFFSTILGSK